MSNSYHYSAKKATISDFDVNEIKLQVQKSNFKHFYSIQNNDQVESFIFENANKYISEQKNKEIKVFVSFIHLIPDVDHSEYENHSHCSPEKCSNGNCPLLKKSKKNDSNVFIPKEVTFIAKLKGHKHNKAVASFTLEVESEDNPGQNETENFELFENLTQKNVHFINLVFSTKSTCPECEKEHVHHSTTVSASDCSLCKESHESGLHPSHAHQSHAHQSHGQGHRPSQHTGALPTSVTQPSQTTFNGSRISSQTQSGTSNLSNTPASVCNPQTTVFVNTADSSNGGGEIRFRVDDVRSDQTATAVNAQGIPINAGFSA